MRTNILATTVFALMFFIVGCCQLEPTVMALRETIKAMRVEDYEKGRVTYSTSAPINSRVLAAKIERLKTAENNAAVALKEKVPFPELLKAKGAPK